MKAAKHHQWHGSENNSKSSGINGGNSNSGGSSVEKSGK